MGADEEGTLERLKVHRRELVDPKIAERRGRRVKTTGDGLLMEFASTIDALRCAIEPDACRSTWRDRRSRRIGSQPTSGIISSVSDENWG